jgi:type II secretory pathway predicted ATPase ExeA
MYERHFGFKSRPFSLTPDPAFLFPSPQHAMAMTMLEYSLESQAPFTLLTGDIGSGKTTLVRRLLRQLGDQVTVGLISNTHAQFKSIHSWALSALGIAAADNSEIALYEALVDSFVREYREGKRTLLIFDEAQNLSIERLEELRLLSNVNSESDTVLQILLVGQPELRDKLSRPELQQFAQRISVDFHLTPLGRAETHAYIRHRLQVAEGDPDLFQPAAIESMFSQTHGVPRLLNRLADFALVYAFADQRATIDEGLIADVLRDRSGREGTSDSPPPISPPPGCVDQRRRRVKSSP